MELYKRVHTRTARFIWSLSTCTIVCLLLAGCYSKDVNKFSDPLIRQIADLKDRRDTDSLIYFLIDKNEKYRAEAALAFASVQDTLASLQLGTMLLEDPFTPARIHAAFALGQTKGFASVNALIPALTDSNSAVVREVLISLGKTISKADLPALTNFQPRDSLTQEGLVWAFYYTTLRGLADSLIVKKVTTFLGTTYPPSVRVGAAHMLGRTRISIAHVSAEIMNSANSDQEANVRMALVPALGRLSNEESFVALKRIVKSDPDYRVRVGAVRVLAANPSPEATAILIDALEDEQEQVGVAAAEILTIEASTQEELSRIIKQTSSFRIRNLVYQKLASQAPEIISEIKAQYQIISNPYERAGLLTALSAVPDTYPFIAAELIASEVPVIKTAAAEALQSINRSDSFTAKMKLDFSAIYAEAIKQGDAGVIAITAHTLADSVLNYRESIADFSFLKEARNKLSLPKDIEALEPLHAAIAYFERSKKPEPPKNEFNHPIDWGAVQKIARDQRVAITTTRGEIVLKLYVEEAPGSVSNFIDLVNKNYFDNRFVHRVVPNFVLQTGCHRGDGFGSEPYSIRSEFSLRRYQEGSVGLASAGKDTEGTQWFITHSATPHLDGRYTVFAEVESGMDVAHKIAVGDQILRVELLDN